MSGVVEGSAGSLGVELPLALFRADSRRVLVGTDDRHSPGNRQHSGSSSVGTRVVVTVRIGSRHDPHDSDAGAVPSSAPLCKVQAITVGSGAGCDGSHEAPSTTDSRPAGGRLT